MDERWELYRKKIIGLGEASMKKSYYPELQLKIEALEGSQGNLQSIFNSISDGIIVHSEKGKILSLNKRAKELFNIEEKDLARVNFFKLCGDEDIRGNLSSIWQKVLKGRSLAIDWEIKHKKTRGVTVVQVIFNRIVWNNQKSLVAVIRDITEQKLYEQQLIEARERAERSEELYRSIVDLSPEGIMTMSLTGIILTVNKSFIKYGGYEEADFVGKSFLKIPTLIKQDLPTYKKIFNQIVRGNIDSAIEFKWKHKSGDIHYGEVHVAIIKKGRKRFIQGIIRNITESKIAREQLKKSEERYNLALQAVNEGIWDWDVEEDKVYFDTRYYTLAGYEANEFPHKLSEWHKRIHPNDVEPCLSLIQANLLRKAETFDMEFRFLRKDGTWMWIRGRGKTVERDKKGLAKRIIGTHSDITDRKLAEEAFKEKSIELENYFANALDLFCIADLDGNFVRVNKAWEETLGYSVTELEKRKFLDFVHPEDLQPTIDVISKLEQNEKVLNFINRYRSKNGTYRFIEWRSIPYNSLIFAAARDITNQRELMNNLIESQHMLRIIIDTIPVRVFWKDLEGKYLGCNNLFAADAGKPSPESLIGQNDFDLSWLAQADLYRANDQEVIIRNEPKLNFEEPQTTPAGDKIWLRTSKIPLRDSNNIVFGVLGTYEDITERKKLDVELNKHKDNLEFLVKERTEELEAANEELVSINEELFYQRKELEKALKNLKDAQKQIVISEKMASIGVLTSGIAHEINNPINFISSGTVGLEMQIDRLLSAIKEYTVLYHNGKLQGEFDLMESIDSKYEVTKAIENIPKLIKTIHAGVERTTAIVKGLRTFSRMDEESKVQSHMNDLINSTLTILYNKYKNRIEVQTFFDEQDEVMCFPGKMGQLILNLIINAIQSIEGQGLIKIETANDDQMNIFKVVISDTGKGMSEEVQKKIFDPFFTTKPIGQGTGLGLAIVHSIVKEHNGKIEISSTEGQGTTVTVTIPNN
jgi:PAS domain S-box-containing protein